MLPSSSCRLAFSGCHVMALARARPRHHSAPRAAAAGAIVCSSRCPAAPDSVALLLLLRELEAAGELTVAGAAHLNHRLRGAKPTRTRRSAGRWRRARRAVRAERIDVRALARAQSTSVEDAGAVGALRVPRARRGRARRRRRSPSGTRATIRPRRSCCGCCAAPGPRGLGGNPAARAARVVAAAARRRARASLRALISRELGDCAAAVPRGRVERRRQRFRGTGSGTSCCRFSKHDFSPGVTDVLAREAALARQDEDFLQR